MFAKTLHVLRTEASTLFIILQYIQGKRRWGRWKSKVQHKSLRQQNIFFSHYAHISLNFSKQLVLEKTLQTCTRIILTRDAFFSFKSQHKLP